MILVASPRCAASGRSTSCWSRSCPTPAARSSSMSACGSATPRSRSACWASSASACRRRRRAGEVPHAPRHQGRGQGRAAARRRRLRPAGPAARRHPDRLDPPAGQGHRRGPGAGGRDPFGGAELGAGLRDLRLHRRSDRAVLRPVPDRGPDVRVPGQVPRPGRDQGRGSRHGQSRVRTDRAARGRRLRRCYPTR